MGTKMARQHRTGTGSSELRSRARPGFLLTISVAGLVAVASLAFVVSRIVGASVRTDGLAGVTNSVKLLAEASFGPNVTSAARLNVVELRALDQIMLTAHRTAGVSGVTIWNLHDRVLYSTDHRLIGTTAGSSSEAGAALTGRAVTTVEAGPVASQQIRVVVPVYGARGTTPIAAAQVSLPYAQVAEDISTNTKQIDYILIGAALLLYATLWPTLLRASRAVRAQSDPRSAALLRELADGMKNDQLLLHYQPTVELTEGRVVAVEALLRWQHPKRGLLAPTEFLPTVTDHALNSQLALYVVDLALRDCREWRDRGIDAGVNVNLSVANVLDDTLPDEIGKMLASCGIPPSALGLEVTETAIVADELKATTMLRALDSMGVRIAIDDFGTGHSSLACLRDLPVSELKIDRAFVAGVCMRPRDKAIVRLITMLAHGLEVQVIAEGVEDEETVNELAELGVDMAQGYYFSRPMPLADLVAWFEAPLVAGRVEREPALAAAD
jgi:EAL domain-containing protein (putative c-di-GMP-specific phosphodiesterase class I)